MATVRAHTSKDEGPQILFRVPETDYIRVIIENFQRIDEWQQQYSKPAVSPVEQLATLVGGTFVEVQVEASTGLAVAQDTRIEHALGYIPTTLWFVTDMLGKAGGVLGIAGGGDPVAGENAGAWTSSAIFVRATVSSTYQFIVR